MAESKNIVIRQQCEARLAGLRTARYSWWVHWAELARYILPRRYRWLVTPNQWNRGSAINGAIIDSTGTIAARVLASGMMSGITSPTRPWFKLRVEGIAGDEASPINLWLAEVEKRMMRVFQESNFYNGIAVVYMDLGVFGTAPMLIYENFENVIICYNPCAGEYYVANNDLNEVDVFGRDFVLTAAATKQWFGEDKISTAVKGLLQAPQRAGQETEVEICHLIQPNTGQVPDKFKYVEVYWEKGSTNDQLLRLRGFYEFPLICPRWDVTSDDAYGRSPGMDALGDIKQLQQETKRKAQAIDKLANPPMVADVELKNQPASTLPGGVTYITKKEGVGFAPAYQNFRPPIQELMQDIAQVQARIKTIFFNDLFLMFQELQAEPRSATAVDARREEKLVMLGPVLDRLQTEALDKIIDRTFAIMNRAGLLPPAPEEIQGAPIQVEYVSMLATAQNAVDVSAIERVLGMAGSLVPVDRTVMDNINVDRTIRRYGTKLTLPPDLWNTLEEMEQLRVNRAEQEQAAAMPAIAKEAVDAGKVLSETPLGDGKTALQQMMQ